jgi:hypothetical protein
MCLLSDQRIALSRRLAEFNDLIYWKKRNLAQAFWQSVQMTEQEKKVFINQALAQAVQTQQTKVIKTLIEDYKAQYGGNIN